MADQAARQERPRQSDREQAELIRGLYRNVPVGVAGALFGVTVLSWVLVRIAPARAPVVGIWFGLTLAVAAWQLILWAWYSRQPRPDGDWRIWARRFVIASLAEGFRWGVGGVFLAAPGHVEQQVWVCMVVACAASASVSSLGSYIPAFYALLFPALMPFVVWSAFQTNPLYWALGLLALALTGSVAVLGFGQGRFLAEALRLRFENLDLADDLRRQKDIAEQANLAKTQFLAAASHDLRQPIHALGMFVEALGRTRLDRDGVRLAGQVAETVQAMSGLFDSLLGISQLDAGVVRPASRAFAVQPLLERICREQAAELEGRPVRLRLVASSAVVETDPLLLERMLRNVISNAVRYTVEGRVLVGCRRGPRLTIEVSDTGPGVSAAHQEAVFEEYFQVANPERDRTMGLGLGLAITRRLSVLLDCPIGLSAPSRGGTTFRISVPVATREAEASAPEPLFAPPIRGGRVFVIDDDPAVQQGTADLLRLWGYDVAVAESAAELLSGVAGGAVPDLLICDWRLRGGETGLGAIRAIRAAYGAEIPALLITGDTAPTRLREADRTGLVLLHKPVPPGKLRAALGNLIRREAPAQDAAEAVR
ncbi:hybrid sensor histidine kinase/response regulator [Phenylobacterium sp.]|uniref:ATP-binding response regulator n=1 Tax=Phenylobacterium sp. TaxID=1871053 RepID=UPI00260100CE|nr:hybrid sensor histidine kinase/response regulator [Phenylobacterium sp.]